MKLAMLAAAIGFVVAYVLIPPIRILALKLGVVAEPGGRRLHTKPTPLLGGLAMFAAVMLAACVCVAMDGVWSRGSHPLWFSKVVIGVLIGASFVAMVGVLDDKYELPGWVQAGTIMAGGVILALFGVGVHQVSIPILHHPVPLGLLSAPFTVVWVLMVTKAIDCMDGLDGLAGGITAIASGTLLLMALVAHPVSPENIFAMRFTAVLSAAVMGASLAFLRFNYPPAMVFMGTVGAQFLGFMLAAMAILGAFKTSTLVALFIPVLVLGIPLGDTAFVVIRRLTSGKKIHEADTTHLHHRLMSKGWSPSKVIWIIYGLTFVLCGGAFLLFRCTRW